MSFLSGLTNILTGGLSGTLFPNWGHNNSKKADPYQALLDKLNPLIQLQTNTATQANKEGFAATGKAYNDLDYVSDFFKKTLTGSDDELLKMLDASGLTKNIDENQQQQADSGVRGGARAATIGNASFDRDAFLNKVLAQLRYAAPHEIASIAQQIGALGSSELGMIPPNASGASGDLFGIEQLKQADKARKAALIGNILSSLAGAAGTIAGAA